MNNLKACVINLGCDKNRIDSEIMLNSLSNNYKITDKPEEADIIIINTCGFIEDSKQESINTILYMANYKKQNCKALIATGCLTQRYGKKLLELMPEIDGILGVNDYIHLNDVIEGALNKKEKCSFCSYSDININTGKRVLTTKPHIAYLRISEGCNNSCAYCAIPQIRGKFRSRSIEDIYNEAIELVDMGVKELILVAQDTTMYGVDLYGQKSLHLLLNKLSNIKELKWIRLLYCYAEEITDEIIDEIASNEKVCKYIDIPLQHISDNILKNMRRRGRKKVILNNINKIREKIPNVILRTTFIVGFPGEKEEEFNELKNFIKKTRFDKLGVFKYSREEDTAAYDMPNQIDEEVKEFREAELMFLQQNISFEINLSKIGKVYEAIVDEYDGQYYHVRSYEMAPEVDGEILVKSNVSLNAGDIVNVKIIKALEYDLMGVINDESSK
ncbi:ribosomal protein S12 methylthiotransferase RimO [Clostridium tepidiprofundi DSM 19306]|uniref:Ribosomal protein uS12 methylthiotransferase RimO n=1 Tax=Clostridium tepidiprofundi DSM 19306 TaxID=1121338 RepID=A0A151B7L3_9CLOT|nr:30S ribosomal protein S12 methylthiotransferase RimO [Clostridium tepidiprofundi]KYH35780.1 ribosomal protein S12 methylthiotransferase RimO [Clostridium tepidiprofundi DSM 19306]